MPSDESKGSQLDAIGSLAQRQLDNTPKSIHRCRRYPTKFNSGRDIPFDIDGETQLKQSPGKPGAVHAMGITVTRVTCLPLSGSPCARYNT